MGGRVKNSETVTGFWIRQIREEAVRDDRIRIRTEVMAIPTGKAKPFLVDRADVLAAIFPMQNCGCGHPGHIGLICGYPTGAAGVPVGDAVRIPGNCECEG